jgi:hypothetical protein
MQSIRSENKRCPVLFVRDKYVLSILIPENRSHYSKPTFNIPLRTFLRYGTIWAELNLCTIFWEQPIYGIYRNSLEREYTKIAYLIAFASDMAPICKAWAKNCLENTVEKMYLDDEAYVEIVLFDETLKDKMIDAITRMNGTITTEAIATEAITENGYVYTVIDN